MSSLVVLHSFAQYSPKKFLALVVVLKTNGARLGNLMLLLAVLSSFALIVSVQAKFGILRPYSTTFALITLTLLI